MGPVFKWSHCDPTIWHETRTNFARNFHKLILISLFKWTWKTGMGDMGDRHHWCEWVKVENVQGSVLSCIITVKFCGESEIGASVAKKLPLPITRNDCTLRCPCGPKMFLSFDIHIIWYLPPIWFNKQVNRYLVLCNFANKKSFHKLHSP